jgi:hypothetical protein
MIRSCVPWNAIEVGDGGWEFVGLLRWLVLLSVILAKILAKFSKD